MMTAVFWKAVWKFRRLGEILGGWMGRDLFIGWMARRDRRILEFIQTVGKIWWKSPTHLMTKWLLLSICRKDSLPEQSIRDIIPTCAGECYRQLPVTTEGVDALKSLRLKGLHIETKHLESGVSLMPTEGEKAVWTTIQKGSVAHNEQIVMHPSPYHAENLRFKDR